MLLLGIDENGLAPLLGPFVITGTIFRVENPKQDLWEDLEPVVSRDSRDFPKKVIVNDSKIVFQSHSRRGFEILEATTEAFSPQSPHLPEAPNALFLGRKSITLPPHRFNREIRDYPSKNLLNLDCFLTVIGHFLKRYPNEDFRIVCGKIGGTKNYLPYIRQLAISHPTINNWSLAIIQESPSLSSYELAERSHRVLLSFIRSGESKHLPIALSSMIGKYIREVYMRQFNSYFRSLDPSLPYTSGYPNRNTYKFLKRSEKLRRELRIPDEEIIRSR